MKLVFDSTTSAQSKAVIAWLGRSTRTEFSRYIEILEAAETLTEAKTLIGDDFCVVDANFTLVIRENYQFVVATLTGRQINRKTLEIRMISFE